MTHPNNPFAMPEAPQQAPVPAYAPQQYAPAPAQQYAPAPAQQYVPPVKDPFSAPAAPEPRGPRLRDIYGRLILLIPLRIERGIPNRLQKGTVQDRMTADVIVLDGGPIHYGGSPEKTGGKQHDKIASPPHRTKGQYISSVGLISQCREALAKRERGEPGMVLGRLTVGEASEQGKEPPWLLQPYTEQDAAVARQYLATVDPFA